MVSIHSNWLTRDGGQRQKELPQQLILLSHIQKDMQWLCQTDPVKDPNQSLSQFQFLSAKGGDEFTIS